MTEKKNMFKMWRNIYIYISQTRGLWQIFRTSGIPYIKNEFSVMIYEEGWFHFLIQPPPLKLNSIRFTYFVNRHDEKAMDEILNNRCIMKDCDGKIRKI